MKITIATITMKVTSSLGVKPMHPIRSLKSQIAKCTSHLNKIVNEAKQFEREVARQANRNY